MNDDDLDRAAILARRQRFIALALAGISGLAAESVLAAEPPAESVVLGREHDPRCELIGDDLPPLPSPTPPLETLSEAERYEQAKQRYAAAKQAHADGDYDQTIIELEAADERAPSSAPEPCLSICRPSKVERNACEQKRERKARLRAERRKRRGQ